MVTVPTGIVLNTGAAPEYENVTVVVVAAPAELIGPRADIATPPVTVIPTARSATRSAPMAFTEVLLPSIRLSLQIRLALTANPLNGMLSHAVY
jgi:hypothetical protein